MHFIINYNIKLALLRYYYSHLNYQSYNMSSLIRLKIISDSIYLYNNKSKIRERGGGGVEKEEVSR
jgi:transposase-like protein